MCDGSAVVGAIDQQAAHTHVPHFGEGDFLRAVSHRQSTSATHFIAGRHRAAQ